jgi:hypothetical protein
MLSINSICEPVGSQSYRRQFEKAVILLIVLGVKLTELELELQLRNQSLDRVSIESAVR